MTNEEKRALDRAHLETYKEARLAAEAHREVSWLCNFSLSLVMFYCWDNLEKVVSQFHHMDNSHLV